MSCNEEILFSICCSFIFFLILNRALAAVLRRFLSSSAASGRLILELAVVTDDGAAATYAPLTDPFRCSCDCCCCKLGSMNDVTLGLRDLVSSCKPELVCAAAAVAVDDDKDACGFPCEGS